MSTKMAANCKPPIERIPLREYGMLQNDSHRAGGAGESLSCLRVELLPWTEFVWEKCTREHIPGLRNRVSRMPRAGHGL